MHTIMNSHPPIHQTMNGDRIDLSLMTAIDIMVSCALGSVRGKQITQGEEAAEV